MYKQATFTFQDTALFLHGKTRDKHNKLNVFLCYSGYRDIFGGQCIPKKVRIFIRDTEPKQNKKNWEVITFSQQCKGEPIIINGNEDFVFGVEARDWIDANLNLHANDVPTVFWVRAKVLEK